MGNTIQKQDHLLKFLAVVLPEIIPYESAQTEHIRTREDFIKDVEDGMKLAPMSVRLTPHVLSVIDWSNPVPDPVRRQFIPMKSTRISDHAKLELDSLHEADDSPVPGLVHRYPDKALFLGQYQKKRNPSSHNSLTYYLPLCQLNLITYVGSSYIGLSGLLSLLHPFLFRRPGYPIQHEKILQTDTKALGKDVRIHRANPGPNRHCRFRRRLVPPTSTTPDRDRRTTTLHPPHPSIPASN